MQNVLYVQVLHEKAWEMQYHTSSIKNLIFYTLLLILFFYKKLRPKPNWNLGSGKSEALYFKGIQ